MEYTQLTPRGQIGRLRALARRALALYGIEPASLALLGNDYNTLFRVTGLDGSQYLFRIQRRGIDLENLPRWLVRTKSEVWWLDRLRGDLNLPVPAVVHAPGGDGVIRVSLEGVPREQYCILFRWMKGRRILERLMPAHLERVGRLTAQLHNYSQELAFPTWFDRPPAYDTDERTAESVVRLFTDQWSAESGRMMQAVFRHIWRVQEALGYEPEVFGLIHADIHQRNYLFDDGDVRLIDFDDCGWGHHLYDMAVTLTEIASARNAPALRAALLSGYRRQRELSATHERMIDAFYMARVVQNISWFLEDKEKSRFADWSARVTHGLTALDRILVGTD